MAFATAWEVLRSPFDTLSWRRGEYQYTSLGDGQVRLLHLYPSRRKSAKLRGELVPVSLDQLPPPAKRRDRTPPPSAEEGEEEVESSTEFNTTTTRNNKRNLAKIQFEALSYCWGSPDKPFVLSTPDGTILITASLASALRRLRHASTNRILWADALCINQADLPEKQIQIGLMSAIYGSAARVVCDLGWFDDDANLVLDAMDRYWRRFIHRGMARGHAGGTSITGENLSALLNLPLPNDDEMARLSAASLTGNELEDLDHKKLTDFMSRPWFLRLWVVQEFVLAREVVMLCGNRYVPWGEMWAATLPYYGVTWPWYRSGDTTDKLVAMFTPFQIMGMLRIDRSIDRSTKHGRAFADLVKELGSGTVENLSNLCVCLLGLSSSRTALPRDRYFAILGLADDAGYVVQGDGVGVGLPKPDYQCPMRDVTMQFWKYCMLSKTGGELIVAAGTAHHGSPTTALLAAKREELIANGVAGVEGNNNISNGGGGGGDGNVGVAEKEEEKPLPSWIWDVTRGDLWATLGPIGPFATACHKAASPSSPWNPLFDETDDFRLCLRAYRLDVVSIVSQLDSGPTFDPEIYLDLLEDAFRLALTGVESVDNASDAVYRPTGEPLLVAALKTLCNSNADDGASEEDYKVWKEGIALTLLFPLLWSPLPPKSPLRGYKKPGTSAARQKEERSRFNTIASKFQSLESQTACSSVSSRIYSNWKGRFVRSQKGFFGVLPVGSRPGDSLWIVSGVRLPLVLRPSESHPGMYEYVGAGYIYGFMNGEALELPGFRWGIVSLR